MVTQRRTTKAKLVLYIEILVVGKLMIGKKCYIRKGKFFS